MAYTSQDLGEDLLAGFRAAKSGEDFRPFESQGWRDGYLTHRKTAAESVASITISPRFQQSAGEWRDLLDRLQERRQRAVGLRLLEVFTEADIHAASAGEHRTVYEKLVDICSAEQRKVFAPVEGETYDLAKHIMVLKLLSTEWMLIKKADAEEACL